MPAGIASCPKTEAYASAAEKISGRPVFSTPRLASSDPRYAADLLCHLCRQAPPAFVKAVAYGVYQGQLRTLIHLLKYDGMRPIARHLGQLLAQELGQP